MDVLHELFYGEISPWNDKIPESEIWLSAKTEFGEKAEEFKAFLLTLPNAEEAIDMYVDVMCARGAVTDIEYYEYFIKGWKLCTKLMFESML